MSPSDDLLRKLMDGVAACVGREVTPELICDLAKEMTVQLSGFMPQPFRIESCQSNMQDRSLTYTITNQPPKPSE